MVGGMQPKLATAITLAYWHLAIILIFPILELPEEFQNLFTFWVNLSFGWRETERVETVMRGESWNIIYQTVTNYYIYHSYHSTTVPQLPQ